MPALELEKSILKNSANLKACLYCRKEIKRKWRFELRNAKYCTQKCYIKARTGTFRTEPKRTCKHCGVTFIDRRYRRKYCSFKCWLKSRIKGKEYFKCSVCGKQKRKDFSPDHSNKYCSRKCFNSIKGKLRPPTNIETVLYEELKKRGLLFETQRLIDGKFCVDAYIPSLNMIVEADGKYWHNLPKTQKKDRAENAYLKSRGYKLLRLSEQEIMDGSFREKLN